MRLTTQTRSSLLAAIGVAAVLNLVWDTVMLVGGLDATGQLDTEFNPIGSAILVIVAATLVMANGLFFYVLFNRRQSSPIHLWAASAIVAFLIALSSLCQLTMLRQGAVGEGLMSGADARVARVWDEAQQIDTAMVSAYRRQVDFYATRMREEAETGRGPRWQAARDRRDALRAQFGASLATPLAGSRPDQSLTEDAQAAAAFTGLLARKAGVFERFAKEERLGAQGFDGRIEDLQARVENLAGATWVDQRSLIYADTIAKLGEMVASFGLADGQFTTQALTALGPNAVSLLLAILIAMLRDPEETPEELIAPKAAAWRDGEPCWEPGDAAWGDVPSSDNVH
jgi:hypothetical protein